MRTLLPGGNVDQVKQAMQELEAIMQRIGTTVYNQGGPQPSSAGEAGPHEEGTIEGEFREV